MDTPFDLIHADDTLLVVDKPAGLSTIPERNPEAPTVQKTLETALQRKLYVVHRLDKEVSGLLVFALDPETHRAWSMAFESRAVQKTYLAWVWGAPDQDRGIIDAPVREFGSGRMGVDARGKVSVTEYRVLAREGDRALLELHPLTGRRHQLRVHLYHIGHPILGDTRYGPREPQSTFPRLYLHSWKLEAKILALGYRWESPPREFNLFRNGRAVPWAPEA